MSDSYKFFPQFVGFFGIQFLHSFFSLVIELLRSYRFWEQGSKGLWGEQVCILNLEASATGPICQQGTTTLIIFVAYLTLDGCHEPIKITTVT